MTGYRLHLSSTAPDRRCHVFESTTGLVDRAAHNRVFLTRNGAPGVRIPPIRLPDWLIWKPNDRSRNLNATCRAEREQSRNRSPMRKGRRSLRTAGLWTETAKNRAVESQNDRAVDPGPASRIEGHPLRASPRGPIPPNTRNGPYSQPNLPR